MTEGTYGPDLPTIGSTGLATLREVEVVGVNEFTRTVYLHYVGTHPDNVIVLDWDSVLGWTATDRTSVRPNTCSPSQVGESRDEN